MTTTYKPIHRLLHVTTPLMHGRDVEQAQYALGHNKYDAFAPGPIDGQYGTKTMAATRRAQWTVGFQQVNGVYGPDLDRILHGRLALTPDQARLRAQRRHVPSPTLGEKALTHAKSFVGTHEDPWGSNEVVFSRWYRLVGPWCAMFASYCLRQAGSTIVQPGQHYAYVPYIVADARAGGRGLSVTTEPVPGCLVVFAWGGADSNPLGDHVGFFAGWENHAAGTFHTVEGNTSLEGDTTGSQSNGGIVAARHRSRADVVDFIHVWR